MAETMKHRIAKAIEKAGGESDMLHYSVESRPFDYSEVVEAVLREMRKPSARMVTEGGNAEIRDWSSGIATFVDDPTPIWDAMISAALSEGGE